MQLSQQINEIIDSTKKLSLEIHEDSKVLTFNKELSSAVQKTIDHASKYIIKAMPVPDAIKDILIDIKDVIKTKDVKQIIDTVIKSSVREGLEIIGVSGSSVNSITELKNIATKGGFITSLKNGIEIVAKNYLKNNIVGDYVYNFFNKLKEYIMNKEFGKSLNNFIKKLEDKRENFFKKCDDWYSAYKDGNLDKLNTIANELDNNKYILSRYTDCIKENSIIQNMTCMLNNTRHPLTENQQRLCHII